MKPEKLSQETHIPTPSSDRESKQNVRQPLNGTLKESPIHYIIPLTAVYTAHEKMTYPQYPKQTTLPQNKPRYHLKPSLQNTITIRNPPKYVLNNNDKMRPEEKTLYRTQDTPNPHH